MLLTALMYETLGSDASDVRLNLTSKMRTDPSRDPDAMTNGLEASWVIDLTLSVWPLSIARRTHVFTSNIDTCWSPPPHAISCEFNQCRS